jgi:hypothetical protein
MYYECIERKRIKNYPFRVGIVSDSVLAAAFGVHALLHTASPVPYG